MGNDFHYSSYTILICPEMSVLCLCRGSQVSQNGKTIKRRRAINLAKQTMQREIVSRSIIVLTTAPVISIATG